MMKHLALKRMQGDSQNLVRMTHPGSMYLKDELHFDMLA